MLESLYDYINLKSSDSLKFIHPIQYSSNYQNQVRIIKFVFFFEKDKIEDELLTNINNEVIINGN